MTTNHYGIESSNDLVPLSLADAETAFHNFAIYYTLPDSNVLLVRTWWTQVDGRWHTFPMYDGAVYYIAKVAHPRFLEMWYEK